MQPQQNFIFFCSHRPKSTGFLSNWFESEFTEDNFIFNCVEQYMMYKKAILMGDQESADRILKLKTPKSIKTAGRKVSPWDEDLWNKHKEEIVCQGLRLKFSQNPELLEKLVRTGDKILVEAAHYDKVWGIGLRQSDPKACNPKEWPGKNLLGKCLMSVREEMSFNDIVTRSIYILANGFANTLSKHKLNKKMTAKEIFDLLV